MSNQTNTKTFPVNEVTPFSNIREMLDIAEREAGDHIAYKFRVHDAIREVTYKEFIRDVNALGSALTELGVMGEHLCNIGENSYQWIVVYLTALMGTGVYVPIDKELPQADILHIANNSESTVFCYTTRFSDMVHEQADKELSGFKYFIHVETPEEEVAEESDPRFLSFRTLIEHGKELLDNGYTGYLDQEVDHYGLKMIVYTSGTTGIAKGVMLCEHNLCSGIYYGLQVSNILTTSLSVLPYHHTYEAIPGLLVALHKHVTVCINENLKTVMKNLAAYKPDFIYLVPAFVEEFHRRIWLNAQKSGKEKGLKTLIKISNGLRKVGIDARRKLFATIHEAFGGNLQEIVCGGAPIRPEIGAFFDSIGIMLINGYGITECSPLVSVNRIQFNDWSTVGMPLPCCQIRIDDMTPEGIGEICVKGDVVMLGYYKNPEATAEVLDEEGWFRTGDYGLINEHGQLVITGRKKNIIVLSNGKNIYPEEIENYIMNIPYIKEVVVYAPKNEHGEETKLVAEVFLNDDKVQELGITDPLASLKADVAKACKELPIYKKVAQVVIRATEFEKNSSKKIKRQCIDHAKLDDAGSN